MIVILTPSSSPDLHELLRSGNSRCCRKELSWKRSESEKQETQEHVCLNSRKENRQLFNMSSPFVFQEPETATYGFNKSISLVFQERC